jgi:hypothetical protein
MRLAPEPPALLGRLGTAAADTLVASLRGEGVAALAVDVRCPTDLDRTVAHHFSLGDHLGTFTPRTGKELEVAWPDVAAILHGVRATHTEVERFLSPLRLSLSDELPLADDPAKKTRTRTERREEVILLYARDGRVALLSADELAFSDLGAAMQPTSAANIAELAKSLRARAPSAFYDDRLVRLGRRPLPFLVEKEARVETSELVRTRTDTRARLDVLAEVLWRALLAGLFP